MTNARDDDTHPNRERCPNAFRLTKAALAAMRAARHPDRTDDDRANRAVEIYRVARLALYWGIDIPEGLMPGYHADLKETVVGDAEYGTPARRKYRGRGRRLGAD